MFSSGVNQASFFNASVSIIFLIVAYALWLPSNDGQELTDLAPKGT